MELSIFERLYGFPDGYEVAGRVCQALAAMWCGKSTSPGEWVPYLGALEREGQEPLTDEDIMARNEAILGAMAEAMKATHG